MTETKTIVASPVIFAFQKIQKCSIIGVICNWIGSVQLLTFRLPNGLNSEASVDETILFRHTIA
uniref:Uncharacterized protein n=1 Tax=Rhizophora mucronata TaxID=61149 RepID=A0A2P2PDF8_RHIMU